MLNTFFGKDKTFSQNRKCLTFWEYEYDDGNKLLNVRDATNHSAGFNQHYTGNSDHYEYDVYGNLIKDRNKTIDNITYNHLNLPKKILFSNGYEILYLYNANGVKVKKTTVRNQDIVNTHYLDGFQYTESQMDFFSHTEGYVKGLSAASLGTMNYEYVYTYTDHLGNIRLRYTMDRQNDELKILEEDHYYPFGLKHKGYNPENYVFNVKGEGIVEIVPVTPDNRDTYKYKFQGQERQDEFGLNWDSFRFRNYSPDLGRFWVIDPLADDYNWQTPYAFSENRVIDGFELEGLERVSFLAVGAFQGNDYAVGAVYDIDTNNVKAGISVGTDKGPFNLLLNYNIDESKTSVSTPSYLDVAGDIKEMNKGSKISSSLINLVDNIGIFNMDNIAKDAQSNINNAFIEAGLSINDANTLTELIVGDITTIVNDIQNGKADLLYSKENDTYKQVTGENGQKQLYKFSDGSSWTVRYNNSNNSVQFIRYTDYDKKENQENGN